MATIVRRRVKDEDEDVVQVDRRIPVRKLAAEVEGNIAEGVPEDATLVEMQRVVADPRELIALDDAVNLASYFRIGNARAQELRNAIARRIILSAAAEMRVLDDALDRHNWHLVMPIWVDALRGVMAPGVVPDADLAGLAEEQLGVYLTPGESREVATLLDADELSLQLSVLEQAIQRLHRTDPVRDPEAYEAVRRLAAAVSGTVAAIRRTHWLKREERARLMRVAEWLSPDARTAAADARCAPHLSVSDLHGRVTVVDGACSVRDLYEEVAARLGAPISSLRIVAEANYVPPTGRIPKSWMGFATLHVVHSRARDDMLPDETGERLAFTQLMSAVQRPEMIGLVDRRPEAARLVEGAAAAPVPEPEPRSFLERLTAKGSSLRMPSGRPYAITNEHAGLVLSMLSRGGRVRRTRRG